MGSVLDVYETSDLGRIVVYYRKNFVCIAEAPERTGVDRAEIAAKADAIQKARISAARKRYKEETKGLPSTNEVLDRHLNERAAAAGKLVQAPFGQRNTPYTSSGLAQADKAAQALDTPQPSSRVEELRAIAAKVMAEAPVVVQHPKAATYATPLEGMTPAERYAQWEVFDARVKARGGDVEVLEEAWQRRFYTGFPTTPLFKAEAEMAKAKRSAQGG